MQKAQSVKRFRSRQQAGGVQPSQHLFEWYLNGVIQTIRPYYQLVHL